MSFPIILPNLTTHSRTTDRYPPFFQSEHSHPDVSFTMAPHLCVPYSHVGAPFAARLLQKWTETLRGFAAIKVEANETNNGLSASIEEQLSKMLLLSQTPSGEVLQEGKDSMGKAQEAHDLLGAAGREAMQKRLAQEHAARVVAYAAARAAAKVESKAKRRRIEKEYPKEDFTGLRMFVDCSTFNLYPQGAVTTIALDVDPSNSIEQIKDKIHAKDDRIPPGTNKMYLTYMLFICDLESDLP